MTIKSPYHYLFLFFFFLISSFAYAETENFLVNSIYFMELLIMGVASLALIFVFILMLNERSRRVKKMTLVYEDIEQKMSIMQIMMNSVREKEKNIIKIVQNQVENTDESTVAPSNGHLCGVRPKGDGKKDVIVDTRTLDVNGRVKQPHLGRENYLIAMGQEHSKGESRVVSIDNALQETITNAVDMSDRNLQKIDFFYQKVSELIETLELDGESDARIRVLSDIQGDFEALLKHQKYNQSTYEKLLKRIVEKPYNYPVDVVTVVLEE